MRPLILCRERLLRIFSILDRRGGKLSIRDFSRSFGVFNWELEQAELLGWVKITTKKPATGRPSRVVAKVSNFQSAKLPLRRGDLPVEISIRHWNFVFAYLAGPQTCNAAAAYQACFHGVRSLAGVRASASRLLKHPDVKAALAWMRASMDSDFPASEKLVSPKSGREIQAIFVRLGHWRQGQL